MPSTSRRAVLAGVATGTLGGLAGCAAGDTDDPPAGSLRFVNDHDLPHEILFRVTSVGREPGDAPGSTRGEVTVRPAQRSLAATETVAPGAQHTYEEVFTEPVYYGVAFTVDGRAPENDGGRIAFHPAPPDQDRARYLSGRVYESGEFSWVVSSTDDPGRFTPGESA